tara:strand:+ start:1636 stop:2244 length:609 start_codon:yes stop_codon:yes gene_type:complete
LIKRSSKKKIDQILEKNNWLVLDVGCGYTANKYANVVCDTQDLKNFYKDKKFIQLTEKKFPFKDKEFDFVIASHVLEHVQDPKYFINEIERVSSKGGYIEVPTKLEDNLVFENKKDHLWHIDYDDDENKILISKKKNYFEPILTVSTIKKLQKYFRKSLVIELYWENEINYSFIDNKNDSIEKISRLSLLRKFISKKIRSFF